ncbi:MAG: class I SAM-dependent methyltransferase, partial [Rhizobiaceae bacterium]
MAGKWRNAEPNQNSAEALAIAHERGLVELPAPSTQGTTPSGHIEPQWLMLDANPLPHRLEEFAKTFICEQGFRPQYLALENSGYEVVSELPAEISNKEGAVIFAGRSRKANEVEFARAWSIVREGGTIIMAGEKTAGIASLRKWVARRVGVDGSFSKHHAQLFWVKRSNQVWPAEIVTKPDDGYVIAPGMFSADGPDPGSQLLADQFDNAISGDVADFGAGWGYLGTELLKRCDNIKALDSYEAHWPSLVAAEENMKQPGTGTVTGFHWIDLTTEVVNRSYDWIVMNPPFHVSRAS